MLSAVELATAGNVVDALLNQGPPEVREFISSSEYRYRAAGSNRARSLRFAIEVAGAIFPRVRGAAAIECVSGQQRVAATFGNRAHFLPETILV